MQSKYLKSILDELLLGCILLKQILSQSAHSYDVNLWVLQNTPIRDNPNISVKILRTTAKAYWYVLNKIIRDSNVSTVKEV